MDAVEQRVLGAKLAGSNDKWGKTLATIRTASSCHEDILKTAASDMGVDAMVPLLLQGPPEWAAHTLRFIPDLGRHREALVRKAAEEPEAAVYALRHAPGPDNHATLLRNGAGKLAASLGNISSMYLKNNGGYVCRFTLHWVNNGQLEPNTSYPDWDDWKWSDRLTLGEGQKLPLSYFALPKAPLSDGTDVWMYLWVQAGTDVDSPLRFTCDSHVLTTADFACDGTTTSPKLGFTGFDPP